MDVQWPKPTVTCHVQRMYLKLKKQTFIIITAETGLSWLNSARIIIIIIIIINILSFMYDIYTYIPQTNPVAANLSIHSLVLISFVPALVL